MNGEFSGEGQSKY